MTTAREILDMNNLKQGAAAKADILKAYRLADEGGVIQSGLGLFGYDKPKLHGPMTLRRALVELGCEVADEAGDE